MSTIILLKVLIMPTGINITDRHSAGGRLQSPFKEGTPSLGWLHIKSSWKDKDIGITFSPSQTFKRLQGTDLHICWYFTQVVMWQELASKIGRKVSLCTYYMHGVHWLILGVCAAGVWYLVCVCVCVCVCLSVTTLSATPLISMWKTRYHRVHYSVYLRVRSGDVVVFASAFSWPKTHQ